MDYWSYVKSLTNHSLLKIQFSDKFLKFLFVTVLGLYCCVQAFSSRTCFSCCRAEALVCGLGGGAQTLSPHGMWDLPGSGVEPDQGSPVLASGFFTTESPGKPLIFLFFNSFVGM